MTRHEDVRIPLREATLVTGPLGAYSRTRAEHARMLRMASWAKRRRRRHGIPEAMGWHGHMFTAPNGSGEPR